jgi:hypothetical protein
VLEPKLHTNKGAANFALTKTVGAAGVDDGLGGFCGFLFAGRELCQSVARCIEMQGQELS